MEALGINIIWIVAYIAIFFILFLVLRKFVSKVMTTVEHRQRLIEDGLTNARAAETLKAERLKEAEGEKQKLLQEAYKDAQNIIDAAKVKETKLLADAQQKAQQIIADASNDLESLREQSKQEGLRDAKEVIALVVKKAFEGFSLDKKTEEELIEKSLKQIKE